VKHSWTSMAFWGNERKKKSDARDTPCPNFLHA
jgi:hypothetical protein